MPKISVIVPVYNTEKYLHRCVDSILAQTYTDFELLLIDDGSTDGSGAICDELAQKDSRVRVFHQENGGVTSARKLGVKKSRGDYIYFVDSDDSIYNNALDVIYACMTDEYDLVVSNCIQDESITCNEYFRRLLLNNLYKAPWGKLYRVSLLKDYYVFETSRYFNVGEDFIMQLRMLKNMHNKIRLIASSGYYYRDNRMSISNTFKPTLEYEKAMIKEVGGIVKSLPARYNVEKYYLDFRLIWLAGMMGLRYNINYNENWIKEIVSDSKNKQLNVKSRLVIGAIKVPVLRYIFVAEKKLRGIVRNVLNKIK